MCETEEKKHTSDVLSQATSLKIAVTETEITYLKESHVIKPPCYDHYHI